jgi:hypothetical protein
LSVPPCRAKNIHPFPNFFSKKYFLSFNPLLHPGTIQKFHSASVKTAEPFMKNFQEEIIPTVR